MKKFIFFLTVCVSCSSLVFASGNQKCEVKITSPKYNGVVKDNGALSKDELFAFTVEGIAKNIGNNFVCIYQKKIGGAEWWRSGNAIGKDDLGPNGEWSIDSASSGAKNNPHPATLIKVLVQKSCPNSGATVRKLGNSECATKGSWKVKTK